jgi:AFG3 family protein
MSERIGNMSYYDSSGQNEYSFGKPYSEQTAKAIDEETKSIIDKAYLRAKDLLEKLKIEHNALGELLLEKEVLFSEDLERILGPRPNGKTPYSTDESIKPSTPIATVENQPEIQKEEKSDL